MAGTWNHNTHYTPWLLGCVARLSPSTALDVGSGDGLLASQLAALVPSVSAIDASPEQTALAASRFPTVSFVTGDVLTARLGTYDVVTCVATLHHLPLEAALARLRALVAPGGTILVVGLARETSPAWMTFGIVTAVSSQIVRRWRGWYEHGAPMTDATDSLAQIREAAERVLPGTRLRRRFYWRYTLEWSAPN